MTTEQRIAAADARIKAIFKRLASEATYRQVFVPDQCRTERKAGS